MILDPTSIRPEDVTGEIRRGNFPSLSQEQLRFGFLPNLDRLQVGDLLLTQPIARNQVAARVSQRAQSNQYVDGAQWTHAAIYVHDWRVIEATPENNVANGTILAWVPGRKILVRRPTALIGMQPSKARFRGMQIALEAAMLKGEAEYGLKSAIGVYFRLGRFRPLAAYRRPQPDEMSKTSIICSGLYAKCYYVAMEQSLLTVEMQRSEEPVTPELLARISTLSDVSVGWSRIV